MKTNQPRSATRFTTPNERTLKSGLFSQFKYINELYAVPHAGDSLFLTVIVTHVLASNGVE